MPYPMGMVMGNLMRKMAVDRPPFGPGFTENELECAKIMEIEGSSFSDPGPDYCDFILKDAEGKELARKRVDGY